ncbi:MAG: type II toxin-antitoxin system mRNA interferase toxin, RelE/StbE family [Patescibacteria group bacterium]|jgi:addiction module RelE/StbE family toxin
MLIKNILYHPAFVKEFKKLDAAIQQRAMETERLFRSNPLHPSLRLHQLKGRLKGSWSVSVNLKIRIIFKRMSNGDIVFYSIGVHDIYRSL